MKGGEGRTDRRMCASFRRSYLIREILLKDTCLWVAIRWRTKTTHIYNLRGQRVASKGYRRGGTFVLAKIKPSKPSNLNDAHLLNLRLAPTHPFNHVSATVGRRKQGGERGGKGQAVRCNAWGFSCRSALCNLFRCGELFCVIERRGLTHFINWNLFVYSPCLAVCCCVAQCALATQNICHNTPHA